MNGGYSLTIYHVKIIIKILWNNLWSKNITASNGMEPFCFC